jgi:hypothetical protein
MQDRPDIHPQKQIADLIQEYDQQGIHRTGTETDLQSAEWLMAKIREIGITPEIQPFSIDRIEPVQSVLVVGKRRLEGVPLFDCARYTDADGIHGRLGHLDDENAEIGVWLTPPWHETPEVRKLNAIRRQDRCRAIIAITITQQKGLFLLNGNNFNQPFGPPVLQISSCDCDGLTKEIETGTTVNVIVQIRRHPAKTGNVWAVIKGRDRQRPPLVVMTPRTGWWQCAAERGGGIAGLLEIMRAISRCQPIRDVIFTANSGHELNQLGMTEFLRRHPELIQRSSAWIHLGANFAAQGGMIRLAASDKGIEEQALSAFKAQFGNLDLLLRVGNKPVGEVVPVKEQGGRYLSLNGDNPLFHSPEDRWPQAVDIEKTTRVIAALCKLAIFWALTPDERLP